MTVRLIRPVDSPQNDGSAVGRATLLRDRTFADPRESRPYPGGRIDRVDVRAIGLLDDEVAVVDYDDRWPTEFERLATPLRSLLATARIEHMGSTSVPGLAAKPVIDISVGLAIGASLAAATALQCGLEFRAVSPESVLFAIFERPGFRLANVHVRFAGSESERWDLLFRDFLRSHPEAALDYGNVKRKAADTVRGAGRATYSQTKAPFIASLADAIERWAVDTTWELPAHRLD